MARETGLEPATSGVTGRRSNQLSYSPAKRSLAERDAEYADAGSKSSQDAEIDDQNRVDPRRQRATSFGESTWMLSVGVRSAVLMRSRLTPIASE